MGFDPLSIRASCFCCNQVPGYYLNCSKCLIWGNGTKGDEPCVSRYGKYHLFWEAGRKRNAEDAIKYAKQIVKLADQALKKLNAVNRLLQRKANE